MMPCSMCGEDSSQEVCESCVIGCEMTDFQYEKLKEES